MVTLKISDPFPSIFNWEIFFFHFSRLVPPSPLLFLVNMHPGLGKGEEAKHPSPAPTRCAEDVWDSEKNPLRGVEGLAGARAGAGPAARCWVRCQQLPAPLE